MKYPREFTLGATRWSVRVLPDLPDALGQTDYETATILIRAQSNKTIEAQVFCHELIHALLYSTGRLDDHDEMMVDGVSHFLHQFIENQYGGKQ